MLFVATLEISDHANWGITAHRDIVLPSRVHNVKSLFTSVQLGLRSFIIPQSFPQLVSGSNVFLTSPFKMDVLDALIGGLSVSVNNSDVLMPDMPLYAQAKMRSSYRRNHVILDEPYRVHMGSTLRMVLEECDVSPFYNRNLVLYDDNIREALMNYQGLPVNSELGNSYTIKLYLEYD